MEISVRGELFQHIIEDEQERGDLQVGSGVLQGDKWTAYEHIDAHIADVQEHYPWCTNVDRAKKLRVIFCQLWRI